MNMKKRITAAFLAALIASSLCSCGAQQTAKPAETGEPAAPEILGQKSEKGYRYTIYLGINADESYDINEDPDGYVSRANDICYEYSSGFTQYNAVGGWLNDETGQKCREISLVYIIYDIDEDSVKKIADKMLEEFEQTSVLIEREEVPYIFYYG